MTDMVLFFPVGTKSAIMFLVLLVVSTKIFGFFVDSIIALSK